MHAKCIIGAAVFQMLQLHVLSLACTVLQFVYVLCNSPQSYVKTTTIKPMSELLSKFHQNDYRMTFERLEKVRDNKRYAEFECRTFKYNRTTPVANASCILHIDVVSEKIEIIIQVYKFSSNEYRPFPIHFQINFCDAIASEVMGMNKLVKMGNVVCPVLKGRKYYTYNFAPDFEKFPPLIPNGQYMVELQFTYQNIELFVISGYGTVDRPIPIPDS